MAVIEIDTIEKLVEFSQGVYGRGTSSEYLDVVLTADVDFADLKEYDVAFNWPGCTGTWYINFDGRGHKIDNIYYMGSAAWGLFGTVYGSVQNISLPNMYVTVTANATAAGIAVYAVGAVIKNCHVSGHIESVGYVACGILGFTSSTAPTVSECSFSGTLKSNNATCGIMCSGPANINNCIVTGELINIMEIAVFWGSAYCAMINCCFRAKVTAPSSNIIYFGGSARQSYFVILEGSSGAVNTGSSSLTNVYYDSDKAAAAGISVTAGTAATTVQLKDPVWLREHGFEN